MPLFMQQLKLWPFMQETYSLILLDHLLSLTVSLPRGALSTSWSPLKENASNEKGKKKQRILTIAFLAGIQSHGKHTFVQIEQSDIYNLPNFTAAPTLRERYLRYA